MKMKVTLSMISAVKAVQQSERLQAAALAEQTFHAYFVWLSKFNKYTEAELIKIAGDAAAAEVRCRFA